MVSKDPDSDSKEWEQQDVSQYRIVVISRGERLSKSAQESKTKKFTRYTGRKLKPALNWRWSSLVVAVATVVYTVFAGRQWYVMRDQLRIMQTEQRPWIEIEQARLDDLVVPPNSDTINIQLSFHIKNVGKTPALAIQPYVQAYVNTPNTFADDNALEKKVCAKSKFFQARTTFMSLMPHQQHWYPFGPTISIKTAITESRAGWKEYVKYMTPKRAVEMAKFKNKIIHNVTFVVSGCFDYFLSSNFKDNGHTFFRYFINEELPGGAYAKGVHLPFDGRINPPKVGMTEDVDGNYAQ